MSVSLSLGQAKPAEVQKSVDPDPNTPLPLAETASSIPGQGFQKSENTGLQKRGTTTKYRAMRHSSYNINSKGPRLINNRRGGKRSVWEKRETTQSLKQLPASAS